MTDIAKRIAALSPEKRKLLLQKLSNKKEDVFSNTQIKSQNRESNNFPLSFSQQRLWFLDRLEPGNPAFNICQFMRLSGKLNVPALEQSFQEIVKRHEALRTTFTLIDGEPLQVISPAAVFKLHLVNLQAFPLDTREAEVLSLANQETQKSFDLTKDCLLRVTLLQLSEIEHILLLSIHHIAADAWSIGVLINEITTLYENLARGYAAQLPELPIQYADFAVWQRKSLQGEKLETLLSYWQQKLSGQLPVVELPTDMPRPKLQTFNGARQCLVLSKTFSEQLKALYQREGITLFMILLAGFKTLLYWYTGQEDIVIGTDIANRNQPEIRGLIGFFVNQLVLRTNLSGNPSFRELLERVREVTLDAYTHQDLPFDKLVDVLNPLRHMARSPLFQIKLILENTQIPSLQLSNLTLKPLELEKKTTQLDLLWEIRETEQGIVAVLEYNTDLFYATTIARMLKHFETLLNQIVAKPTAKLTELIELLTAADKQEESWKSKNTKAEYQRKLKTIKRQVVNTANEMEDER
ncbi:MULTISPECIES: condensation domain-containing protein [unclassified Tolypothrix]|uniref:condensation domain-containing protein n=1 Tax=unclassified Tolypothrix TaxID=2649714 RepID=UPI0005EAAA7D|nr:MULTISPECIES: condensation domain-containing protein [unclassified Tolypothrix]BAY91152.1 condensation domain-containing protein [Microchaete diplosiphon NIES-3275]EKE99919.1 condensation domain protein [Tolypothrix sp. PCC 7601]MBE9081407.1 condensation protein [Tolypothrix sp. LEGE 11397]UYD25241.1 condensation protein [Tolypothrix sp. PCC 7712]UYD32520.1 condensation protein [Tolypothrix sp. PCC 7601]